LFGHGRPIRFVGGQAAGCSPVATAFAAGTDVIEPVREPDTIVRSLAIGNPADGDLTIARARESGGGVYSVPEDQVVAYVKTWSLVDDARAKKAMDFARTYRSYVFNYTLGEDIVRAYIGTGPDRVAKFYDILSRPVVPSDLK
jgi:hypothetical protein